MDAYSAPAWTGLCAAAAAASAALAGLVFVGVSINLKEITSYPWLPNRALEAIVLLLLVLLSTTLVLAPGQPAWALGLEILVVTLPAWAIVAVIHRKAIGVVPKEFRGRLVTRIIAGEAAILPFAVAGITLIIQSGGGLYWLLPGVTLANAVAVYNAWVLLVEILR
jgi:modulator of FtsH protease